MMQDICDIVVSQMVAEHRRVYEAEAFTAAVVLTYVVIDSMAWAGLPPGRDDQQRTDFIAWVDRYMTTFIPAGARNTYQYDGVDLYGARCAILHTFSPQVGKRSRHVSYHDTNFHAYDAVNHPELVMLGIELLKDDLWAAVARFVADKRNGPDYARVQERFGQMFQTLPYTGPQL